LDEPGGDAVQLLMVDLEAGRAGLLDVAAGAAGQLPARLG
jgi:hypothetical protein